MLKEMKVHKMAQLKLVKEYYESSEIEGSV